MGRGIAQGFVCYAEHVLLDGVTDGDIQVAGESAFAVRTGVMEVQMLVVGLFRIPYFTVESDEASVQAISPFIVVQLMVLPFDLERGSLDAVGITPDDGTKIRIVGKVFRRDVLLRGVETENHVRQMPMTVPHKDVFDDAP